MKILVTGGAGFLGSHLCKKFLEKNYEVICLDNLGSGRKENIAEFMNNSKFKFIHADVTKDLSKMEKVDIILHFASRASPYDYQENSFETIEANTSGTMNCLEKAKKDNAVILYASTSEIYGQAQIIPTPESYLGYVNSFGPRSCYDESKRLGETYCYEYLKKFNVDARIVRIFNTYGPKMRFDDGRVVTNFIDQAVNNKPITIFGKGTQTRCFCYVDDLINGIYTFATKQGLKGEVINLGNTEEHTMIELAEILIKLTKSNSKIIYSELPKDDPVRRVPDISKAKKLLNWEFNYSFENGLKKFLEEIQK
ncbi:MAG: SDR family NAD(P)-dependent oxidoreductase [Candidatus Nanoarchaeia archaeon]|jgi:nucleoside-diphosphate-sugar epimerase